VKRRPIYLQNRMSQITHSLGLVSCLLAIRSWYDCHWSQRFVNCCRRQWSCANVGTVWYLRQSIH